MSSTALMVAPASAAQDPAGRRAGRWQGSGACRGRTDVMYGPAKPALSLCAACPVRELCLWSALATEEAGYRYGVVGGTTAAERERLAAGLSRSAAREAFEAALEGWYGIARTDRMAALPTSSTGTADPVTAVLLGLGRELGIPSETLWAPGPRHAGARQMAMYVLHTSLGLSYSEIGRALGRDHSTVMHGVARVLARLEVDAEERARAEALVRSARRDRDGVAVGGGDEVVGAAAAAALERIRLALAGEKSAAAEPTGACPADTRRRRPPVVGDAPNPRRRRRDACDEDSPAARVALRVVARDYGLAVADLTGKGLGPQLVEARQAAMYVLRHAAGLGYPGIGRALGGRDNATARHGVGRAAAGTPAARRRLEGLCERVAAEMAHPSTLSTAA